jgi:phospholipase D1/2
MADDEHLAYGDYSRSPPPQEKSRGLFGKSFKDLTSKDNVGSLFSKATRAAQDLKTGLSSKIEEKKQELVGVGYSSETRYESFAHSREGNNGKWYVDGCSYMWAVSVALEQARESIWIMDCRFPAMSTCRGGV